jgi:hypothetical protein
MKQFSDAKPLFEAIAQILQIPIIMMPTIITVTFLLQKKIMHSLSSFKIIEKQPAYRPIIPYYIAEIYYYRGEKDEALTYAESVLGKRQSIL